MSNASPALHSSSQSSSAAGLLTRDHHLAVLLDRSGQGSSTSDGTKSITVCTHEISAVGIDPISRPPLVFLQSRPGCGILRPDAGSGFGWIGAILRHHRLILANQRGTGISTPVDWSDAADTPADTTRLFTHLCVNEIVEDCEDLRCALGLERWSLLDQPFGGFCVIRCLFEHAQGLEKVYVTDGLPAVGRNINEVYTFSYEAMRLKNEEYYTRFLQGRDRMASLVEKAGRGKLRTAGGDFVGPERLRSLGALLGRAEGAGTIRYLLKRDPDSWTFRYDLGQCLPFGDRFLLYAVIHESYWAGVDTIGWTTQWVRPAVFSGDPTPLTGEYVHREALVEDAGLRPWLEVADPLAAHGWPAFYSPVSLKATTTPGIAAAYTRDVFVPMATSLETAALVPGLRTWITNEYEHDGSRVSGGRVFKRLRGLAAGVIAC